MRRQPREFCHGEFVLGTVAEGAEESELISDVSALDCAVSCGESLGLAGAIVIPANEDPAEWTGECECIAAESVEASEGADTQFALLEECQGEDKD